MELTAEWLATGLTNVDGQNANAAIFWTNSFNELFGLLYSAPTNFPRVDELIEYFSDTWLDGSFPQSASTKN